MTKEIKILNLNGEDIIGKVELITQVHDEMADGGKEYMQWTETVYSIEKPYRIVLVPNEQRTGAVPMLHQLCMFGDKNATITINEDKVLFMYEPIQAMQNLYLQQTTGLTLETTPPSNILSPFTH